MLVRLLVGLGEVLRIYWIMYVDLLDLLFFFDWVLEIMFMWLCFRIRILISLYLCGIRIIGDCVCKVIFEFKGWI